jgi:hypothetical protein
LRVCLPPPPSHLPMIPLPNRLGKNPSYPLSPIAHIFTLTNSFFSSMIPGILFDVNRDAYFHEEKDLLSTALDGERQSQRLLQGWQYQRGERERKEWLNQNATCGRIFFDDGER